jgi:hypothetical protein
MIPCHYEFPCHPRDMFAAATDVSDGGRTLRCTMIERIAKLSHTYSQPTLDANVIIDVEGGEIVGMDSSFALGMDPGAACLSATRLRLGQLSADNWKTMRVSAGRE